MTDSEKLLLAIHIIENVEKMRNLQKQFFKGDKHILAEAKKIEREVDELIAEFKTGQTKLFP